MCRPSSSNAKVATSPALLAACLLASLLSSAGCGEGAPSTQADIPTEPVPEVLQRQWPQGDFVFRTAQAWSDAWSAAPSLVIPESMPPQIDFSSKVVIGVDRGWGTSGCAGLSIRRAVEEDTRIVVEYSQSEGTPPPNAGCTAVMVQLVDFAKIPYTNKPVAFVRNDG